MLQPRLCVIERALISLPHVLFGKPVFISGTCAKENANLAKAKTKSAVKTKTAKAPARKAVAKPVAAKPTARKVLKPAAVTKKAAAVKATRVAPAPKLV